MKEDILRYGSVSLAVVGTIILIVLFGISSLGKILEPDTSIVFLNALTGLSETWSRIILVFFITLEAAILFSIILFYNKKWPFYLAGSVLGLFVIIVGYGIWIDVEELCGCFGSIIESTTVNGNAMIRNAVLASLAFLIPELKD